MPNRTNRRSRRSTEPARTNVTLQLTIWMLDRIRTIADNCGIPHEDIIKVWVAERLLGREQIRHRRDVC